MKRSKGSVAQSGLAEGLAAIILTCAAAGGLHAASLFDPTPQDSMRPLSTDRPDVTESPYTVDAGHVQVEAEVFAVTRRGGGEFDFDELRLMQTNIKVGLLDRVDLQVVLTPYVKQYLDSEFLGFYFGDVVQSGDMVFRLKVNLAGNDGGPVAVALLPFVVPPTRAVEFDSRRDPAYGLAIPLALELPKEFGLGVMAQFTTDPDERAYLMTASLARGLGGTFGGFVEIAAERVDGPHLEPPLSGLGPMDFWNTTLDLGVTFGVTPDLQLDGAVLFGLSEEADDLTVYTGITVRR